VKATIWLRIEGKKKGANWWPGEVKASKSKLSTSNKEITIKLELEIPNEVFEEPVFEAKFTLPKTTRQLPTSQEIAKEVGAELTKRMGFRVKLDMGPSDPEAAV
jgi:hypothetical protein